MQFKPFRAVMPAPDKVHLVASRSYVSYSKEDLVEKLNGNPYTFLHIIHPDVEGDYRGRRLAYFNEVRRAYLNFIQEEILVEEDREAFFIYRQETPRFSFTGVIGAVGVEDYESGKIKVHEQTLHSREERFTDYLDVTGINAEPVLLVTAANQLDTVLADLCNATPTFCFSTTDRAKHSLWKVSNAADAARIQAVIEEQNALYIADGHHRSASSVALKQRKTAAGDTDERYNGFMAMVLSSSQLRIFGFHRLFKSDEEFDTSDFLSKISKLGTLTEVSTIAETAPSQIGIYVEGKNYTLSFKKSDDVLDAEWLSTEILRGVFGVVDERHEKQLSYAEGSTNADSIVEQVDSGKAHVAFLLHPISAETLMKVFEEGRSLPPKSTYILPKLRSGLVIYPMRDAK